MYVLVHNLVTMLLALLLNSQIIHLLFHLPIFLVHVFIFLLQVNVLMFDSFKSYIYSLLLVCLCLSHNRSRCIPSTCLSLCFTSYCNIWIFIFVCSKKIWTHYFFYTICWLTNFNLNISNNIANMCWLYLATYWNMHVTYLCGLALSPISTPLGVWKSSVTSCELMLEDILNGW